MEQYIVFTNNHQNFAIEISQIEKIIEFYEPKRVPESSEFLIGVIQYNGKILPVINLTRRLYNTVSEIDYESKIIVASWKGKPIGLVVDNIHGIRSFDEEQYEKPNEDLHVSTEFIQGFIKTEDDITIVLNTDKIFNFDEEKELLEATDLVENQI